MGVGFGALCAEYMRVRAWERLWESCVEWLMNEMTAVVVLVMHGGVCLLSWNCAVAVDGHACGVFAYLVLRLANMTHSGVAVAQLNLSCIIAQLQCNLASCCWQCH